jgi:threonine/homoserine/homoserine lactone efflux protein
MFTFLITGTLLGLSAGFAPGPLLALVVSETLQHDIRAGMKVALAPIITDLPIVIFSLFILVNLTQFHNILGIISLSGACFIFYLGIRNLRIKDVHISTETIPQKSLQKGILANFLSPHPYLFWLTVGGPTTMKAMDLNPLAAAGFILSFYVLLVGSKIFLAIITGRTRTFLQGKAYITIMRLLGLILISLSAFLLHDGLRLLQIF